MSSSSSLGVRNVLGGWAVMLMMMWVSRVEGSFDANISSYLNVEFPLNLKVHNVSGGILHHRAHFGAHFDFFQQSGELVLPVWDAQGPYCDMNANHSGRPNTPYILLAREGASTCSEILQARHAEYSGAAGLLIMAHHCTCDENCTEIENHADCVVNLPQLPDDGTGEGIHIPVYVISKLHGDKISKTLKNGHPVTVNMAWHMPRQEHNVSVDLWHSPGNVHTEEFLSNFSTLALAMGDKLSFTSHYQVFSGDDLGCDTAQNTSWCDTLCTNHHRYCAFGGHGIHGKAVVEESLRRMCIWELYPNQVQYWSYLSHFDDKCAAKGYYENDKCHVNAMHSAHIDSHQYDTCIDSSGSPDGDGPNRFLERAVESTKHVVKSPAMWINHMAVHTPLINRFTFEAMCLAYTPGTAPDVCYACGTCGDPVACASRHPMRCNAHDGEMPSPTKHSSHHKGHGRFWFFFILIILIAIGGYVYYKKYMEDGDGLGGYTLGQALMSDTA